MKNLDKRKEIHKKPFRGTSFHPLEGGRKTKERRGAKVDVEATGKKKKQQKEF